jgi:hypothetical protein
MQHSKYFSLLILGFLSIIVPLNLLETLTLNDGGIMRNLIVVVLLLVTSVAYSKNLSSRFGVGYNAQLSSVTTGPSPAIAVKYNFSPDYAASGFLGFKASGKDNGSNFSIGAKVFRNAYQEDNANFYVGAGGAVSSVKLPGSTKSDSGFDLLAFLGAEFFFDGLPNLGFTFEAGMTLTNRGSGVTFETTGGSFLTTGIFYYF